MYEAKRRVVGRAVASGLCMLGMLGACGAASADVEVQLDVRDVSATPSRAQSSTRGTDVQLAIANGGSSADGAGNISTGILRASAIAALPAGFNVFNSAVANSILNDNFSFSAGSSGSAFLDYGFDGTITTYPDRQGNTAYSVGRLSINLFPSFGGTPISYKAELTNGPTCSSAPNDCFSGSSIALRGTVEVPIFNGSYHITVTLQAGAQLGDTSDFGSTSYLFLRLPDGVSITSDSGQFLTSASPIPAVPEPETYGMLLVGLLTIASVQRKQRHT